MAQCPIPLYSGGDDHDDDADGDGEHQVEGLMCTQIDEVLVESDPHKIFHKTLGKQGQNVQDSLQELLHMDMEGMLPLGLVGALL